LLVPGLSYALQAGCAGGLGRGVQVRLQDWGMALPAGFGLLLLEDLRINILGPGSAGR
jgi:hypothetical protein